MLNNKRYNISGNNGSGRVAFGGASYVNNSVTNAGDNGNNRSSISSSRSLNHNSGTSSNSNNKEAIVDKLHNAISAFRRERDNLHRKKELSVERLRLVTEEKDAVEKTVSTMQEKLNKINAQTGEQALQEIANLEKKVSLLAQEVQFQHVELVRTREKIERQIAVTNENSKKRENSIQRMKDKIGRAREKLAIHNNDRKTMNSSTSLEIIQIEMNDGNGDRLRDKWPRIVEQKAAAIVMETADMHDSDERLLRILQGYKEHFGDILGEKESSLMKSSGATLTTAEDETAVASSLSLPLPPSTAAPDFFFHDKEQLDARDTGNNIDSYGNEESGLDVDTNIMDKNCHARTAEDMALDIPTNS